MLDPLPEDQRERTFWEHSIRVLGEGDRLRHMALQIRIMHHVTPIRQMRDAYAILHNDVLKLIEEREPCPKKSPRSKKPKPIRATSKPRRGSRKRSGRTKHSE